MASNNSYRQPALGQDAYMGAAYNSYRDTFGDDNLLRRNWPSSAVAREKNRTVSVQASPSDSV